MPSAPTDVVQIDEGGAGAAIDAAKLARLALVLKGASTERLKTAFIDQIRHRNTDGALRVSAELATRGVAPCFRGIPVTNEWWTGNPVSDFILLAADLQWIITAHPNHRTDWDRAQSIFDPAKFKKVAQYLYWDGRRTPGQVAKALGLSDEQQRECAWIQCLHVERWRTRLFMRLPVAQAKITGAVRATDRRHADEQDATIKRRVNLWQCAELANWKPQRTADFYAAMTGETLARNVVGNQLAKLPKVRRTDFVFSLEGSAVE